jgi:hypothetical protein
VLGSVAQVSLIAVPASSCWLRLASHPVLRNGPAGRVLCNLDLMGLGKGRGMAISFVEREHRLPAVGCSFIFASTTPDRLEAASARAEMPPLAAGALTFVEGGAGDAMERGGDIFLGEMGPDDSFGQMVLLSGKPRSFSIPTVEDTPAPRLMKHRLMGTLVFALAGVYRRQANLLNHQACECFGGLSRCPVKPGP